MADNDKQKDEHSSSKVNLVEVGKNTIQEFGDDDMPTYAGALTYFIFLAIFPLALLALAVVALLYNSEEGRRTISDAITKSFPSLGETVIKSAVDNATKEGGGASIGGVIGLVFSSLGIFGTLSHAMTIAWDVKAKSNIVFDYFRNLLSLLVAGGLFLAVNVASGVLGVVSSGAQDLAFLGLRLPPWVFYIVNLLISVLLLWLVLIIVYKFLPRTKIDFKDVILGSLVGAVGLTLLQNLFAFYLAFANNSKVYGPLGSLVGLLFYIYIAAQILLIGAEFCSEYAKQRREVTEKGASRQQVASERKSSIAQAAEQKRTQAEEELAAVRARISQRQQASQQRIDPAAAGAGGRTLAQKQDETLVKAAPVVAVAAGGALLAGLLARLTGKK